MSENQYFSHEILNEQERIIVSNARQALIEEINSNNFYSLYAMEQAIFQNWSNCHFLFVRATMGTRCWKASLGCCHVTKA